MSVKAGAVYLDFGMRTEAFKQGMARVNSGLQTMQKRAALAGAAIGAAMTAAAGAMAVAVNKVIGQADQLGYVADNLGVSVEALQELRFAAERSNMAVSNFDVALRRFIRRTAEAAQGTGAAKGAVEELGIQLRDNDGRLKSSETLLSEVADAIMKVGNQADRLRLAQRFFDTDAAAMLGVFASGLNEAREQARGLGIVMSEDTVRAGQAFRNNLDLVSRAKDGLVTKLTAHLLPSLELLSEKFLGFVNDEAAVQAAADGIGRAFAWVARQAAHVAILVDRLRAEIGGLVEAAKRLNNYDFSGAWEAWSGGQEASAKMRDELNAVLQQMESGFVRSQGYIQRRIAAAFGDAGRESGENFASRLADAAAGAGAKIKAALDPMIAEAARIFEATRTPLEQYQAQIARLNELLAAGAINQDTYNRAVAQAQDAFSAAEAAGKKTENVFASIGQSIAQSFGSAIQGIIDGSRSAMDVIRDLMSQLAQMLMNRAFQSLIGFLMPSGSALTNLPLGVGLYAAGGKVSGPGTGTSDSIPAMLSDGEFVVNARSARKFGPLLEAINSGSFQGLKLGGWANPIGEAGPEGIIGRAA